MIVDYCGPTGVTSLAYVLPCTSDMRPFSSFCADKSLKADATWHDLWQFYCVPGAPTTTAVATTLPSTGSNTGAQVALALAILFGGVGLVVITRRRRVHP